MKGWKFIPLLCLIVLCMSCYPITVRHDYDLDTDFSRLKTFDWMPAPKIAISSVNEAITKSTLLEKRVKGAVDSQLEAP